METSFNEDNWSNCGLNFANLPGPKNPLFIGGCEITDVSIFVPQSGNQTLGICFLTYVGKLCVAVHVDTANFPKAEDICEVIKETLVVQFVPGYEWDTNYLLSCLIPVIQYI